jgi:uncharacterized protein (TIGR03083 family)
MRGMPPVHEDAAAPELDFVASYEATAATMIEAVPSCDMNASVPACPAWSAYDLVVHLGNVHAWAATIVETGRSAAGQNDEPGSRRAKAVARWYAGKAEDLAQVLREARPDDPCWTFSAHHHTKGFWPRRQTHETTVHLVDLLQSAGSTPEVPSALAADGVAEVLEVFLPRMHARGFPATISAPILLHATDTGDSWRVAPAPDGEGPAVVGTAGSSADEDVDSVSAPASDLMLLLWKRLPPSAPTVALDGDERRLLDFLGSPLTA